MDNIYGKLLEEVIYMTRGSDIHERERETSGREILLTVAIKFFFLQSFASKWDTVRMHIHAGLFSYTHETHMRQ